MPDPKPKKETLLKRSESKKFKDDGSMPNDDIVMWIKGKKVGSLGNFIALSGKQKSRKTAYLGAVMGSAITGDEILGILCDLPAESPDVLHIDTEQSEYDYKMSIDRMKRLAKVKKLPKKVFNSYRFRDWNNTEIKDFIDEYLTEYASTGLVVIDGITDLVVDFNSIDECKRLTDWLKGLTEHHKVLVICIIHRSKSANFSIGHLGSFIERAAQSALEVLLGTPGEKVVNRNISTLQAEYMRSDAEFSAVSIQYSTSAQTWVEIDNTKE